MARLVSAALFAAIIVAVVIVLADAVTEPTGENCLLDDNILLPDRCFVAGCEGDDFCPPATTRPYLIFWEEAASCPDGNFLCPVLLE